jgi:hypothetical protein
MPPSQWNLFVKKIYHEGKAKNSKYEFKQALMDASKRKSEMKNGTASNIKKHRMKTKQRNMKISGGKSRRRSRRTRK